MCESFISAFRTQSPQSRLEFLAAFSGTGRTKMSEIQRCRAGIHEAAPQQGSHDHKFNSLSLQGVYHLDEIIRNILLTHRRLKSSERMTRSGNTGKIEYAPHVSAFAKIRLAQRDPRET